MRVAEDSDSIYSFNQGPQSGLRPNIGFHSELRNNLNIDFGFSTLIRQNKWNHLLFYVLRFTQFCARKLLLLVVVKN